MCDGEVSVVRSENDDGISCLEGVDLRASDESWVHGILAEISSYGQCHDTTDVRTKERDVRRVCEG